MTRQFELCFCDCCGKKLEKEKMTRELKVSFNAYWRDYDDIFEGSEEFEKDVDGYYRNLIPRNDDSYIDNNHSITVDHYDNIYYHINLDHLCENCTKEVVESLRNVREILKNTAKPKATKCDELANFSTEELLAELESRKNS